MERIEFLMEARLYHAAFAHGKGRLLHNRGINEGEKILQRINIPKNFTQHRAFAAFQPRPQGGELFNRRRKAPELPRVSGAVGDAGHEPLKIIDAGQIFDNLGNSAEVGAKYIVQAVQEQIKKAKEQ